MIGQLMIDRNKIIITSHDAEKEYFEISEQFVFFLMNM